MKTLTRHLLGNNLLIMGICLLASTGIYLLVDVFDRLDRILEKGAAAWEIFVYFGAKIPLILSEILPAVVFLSLAIQISGMQKRREITALEAGGVSFARVVSIVLFLGLIWSGVQLGFSQVLGVYGQQMSGAVWDSLGQEQGEQENRISDLWIRKDNAILHLGTVWPNEHKAQGVVLYALDEDFTNLERLIQADALLAKDQGWQLESAEILTPQSFSFSQEKTLPVDLDFDLRSLQVSAEDIDPEDMSMWELSAHIDRLKNTGANVEALRTAWHLKLSYAFSVFILSAVALVLTRHWENLFPVISCGLGGIFVLLTAHTIGGTLGESGTTAPWIGAWLGNIMVGTLTGTWLGVQIRGRI